MKKKIIFFGVLFLILNYAQAQQTKTFDPKRDLDLVRMDKFVGTWEWKSKNTTYTLILKKWKAGDNFYVIAGWYRFIKDGKIVVDQLDNSNSIKHAGLTGTLTKENDSLNFSFKDLTRKELRHGTLNFVNENPGKILFKLKSEKRRQSLSELGTKSGKLSAEKVPHDLNIILNKVE
ncbi:DUF6705 family protein [Pedobacter gandavensis]|uniref:DUF6705 family protein n=1 Tax=Pedobacter gandavensis TaxID=2679963 RepID=UPI00292FCA5E|nr:DUF6705 family protein [Pedobacter gandavensis]